MYDHQHTDCGVTKALNIIGGKWTLLIIRDLLAAPCRFSELEHSLTGISPRTLALRLKELEQDEIISREIPEGGGHATYRLTEKGQSLQRIIDQLRTWGTTAQV